LTTTLYQVSKLQGVAMIASGRKKSVATKLLNRFEEVTFALKLKI